MTVVPSLFDDEQPTEPNHPGGAPPLDWWVIATTKDEAYRRVILSMCPEKVCRQCGEPSRRIVGETKYLPSLSSLARQKTPNDGTFRALHMRDGEQVDPMVRQWRTQGDESVRRVAETTGFSDCGHGDWRPGIWLDPFNPEAT